MQFENDQRGEHRRQHSPHRAAGLLQKHRHDGDQHSCQIACFLWADLFQPKRHTASTSTAIEAAVPTGKLLRAIADNYATDKHPKVQVWLGRHPAGPSTSPQPPPKAQCRRWLLRQLTSRRLKRGVFRSIVDCRQPLIAPRSEPRPFRWTKDPRQDHRRRQTWAPSVGFYPPDSAVVNSVDRRVTDRCPTTITPSLSDCWHLAFPSTDRTHPSRVPLTSR